MKARDKLEQDEIIYQSGWKAGYEQREKEMNLQTVSLSEMLSNHRKAGIKLVVEWMSGCMLNLVYDTNAERVAYRDYRVYDSEWQAQKEKWGIE